VVCIVIAEYVVRYFAPLPDPYELKKTKKDLNQYIRSEFPRNFHHRTKAEEGLPGVIGSNLFTTNNMGFRGDHIVSPKPNQEFRIFMVGGSTTECLYLDDSQSINTILQQELNKHIAGNTTAKVYNAGKSGDALPDHISMIAHRIVHLKPNVIILFSGINDLTRSIYKYDYLHYIDDGSEKLSLLTLLKFASTEFQLPRLIYYAVRRLVPKPPTEVIEEIPRQSNYREKVQVRKSTPISNRKPRLDLEAYRVNLKTIIGITKAHAVTLVFMTQQSTWNSSDPKVKDWQWILYRFGVTYREDVMNEALESLNDVMRQLAAEHGVPTYDLARLMTKSSDHFYDDVHFNTNGARVAGIELAYFIIRMGLIPSIYGVSPETALGDQLSSTVQ